MADTMSRVPVSLKKRQPEGMALTAKAAVKVAELLASEGDDALALRVAVRPGGCSGLSYEMYFDTEIAADDLVAEKDGVKLLVDPASAPHLKGAVLDYKDGLMDAGFTVENPNVSRSCGCGKSFS